MLIDQGNTNAELREKGFIGSIVIRHSFQMA